MRSRKNWSRDLDEVIRSGHYTWLGMGLGGEPIEHALKSITTDIMHICLRQGISWEQLEKQSREQFEMEERTLDREAQEAAT